MKPTFLNLFMKLFTRGRVVPTISASLAIRCQGDAIESSRASFYSQQTQRLVLGGRALVRVAVAAARHAEGNGSSADLVAIGLSNLEQPGALSRITL